MAACETTSTLVINSIVAVYTYGPHADDREGADANRHFQCDIIIMKVLHNVFEASPGFTDPQQLGDKLNSSMMIVHYHIYGYNEGNCTEN